MEETGILENPALLSSASPDFEPGHKMRHFVGLVQIRCFSGNNADDKRASTERGSQRGAPTTGLGAAETGVTQHFQPMRVRLPSQ
jgi:hypothetical protein